MHVLIVCKFEEDPIKTECATVSIFFQCSRAGNLDVNGRMCPEFELFWAVMVVLQVWWRYDKLVLVSCILLFNKAKNYERFRQEFLGILERNYLPKQGQTRYSYCFNTSRRGRISNPRKSFWSNCNRKEKNRHSRASNSKWVVWFGPKSNSTELLCLSWLPATLMMIRSKMDELAWRHHFPIISLREFF